MDAKEGSDQALNEEAFEMWVHLLRAPSAAQRVFWVAALCGAAHPEGWTSEQPERDRAFRTLFGRRMGQRQFVRLAAALVDRNLARFEYVPGGEQCTLWLIGPIVGWPLKEVGLRRAKYLVTRVLGDSSYLGGKYQVFDGEMIRVSSVAVVNESPSTRALSGPPLTNRPRILPDDCGKSNTFSEENCEGLVVALQLRGENPCPESRFRGEGKLDATSDLGFKVLHPEPPGPSKEGGATVGAADTGPVVPTCDTPQLAPGGESSKPLQVLTGKHPGLNDNQEDQKTEKTHQQSKPKTLKQVQKLAKALVAFWGHRSGRESVRLSTSRVDMVRARLSEGFTAEDLFMALAGITRSPWHQENAFDTFELALRSSVQVEKAHTLWHRHAPIERLVAHYARRNKEVPVRRQEVEAYHRQQAQAVHMQDRLEQTILERTQEAEARRKEEEFSELVTNELLMQMQLEKNKVNQEEEWTANCSSTSRKKDGSTN